MKASEQRSRLKTIAFLKKFRDKRRKAGAPSKRTDLQALRMRSNWKSPSVYLVISIAMLWEAVAGTPFYPVIVVALVGLLWGFFIHRRTAAALGLFDEFTPQDVGELLARIESSDDPIRKKAVAFLEKFSERRRKYDAFSPKSDLTVLRWHHDQSFPYILAPFAVFVLTRRADWHFWNGWFIAALVGGILPGLIGNPYSSRKSAAALALFDECAPQSVDELLELIEAGNVPGQQSMPEGAVAMSL